MYVLCSVTLQAYEEEVAKAEEESDDDEDSDEEDCDKDANVDDDGKGISSFYWLHLGPRQKC